MNKQSIWKHPFVGYVSGLFALPLALALASSGCESLDDDGFAEEAFRFTPNNLALGKPTSQSSTDFGAEALRAVDGNTNGWFWDGSVTHTQAEAQAWWQVDLESIQDIGDIVLYNRADCCSERLSDFQVLVSDDGVTWDSYAYPGQAGPEVTISVNRTGRYVKVQLNGTNVLSLAEVEVLAPPPPNAALGKPTSQSSTALGAEALRAVDGNTNGWFWDGSVTHTQTEAQPWWQLDLESGYNIGEVVLYNRADCCSERLSDFQVLVSDDGVTWNSYPHPGVAGSLTTFDVSRTGRYVKVQLNGTNALSLAEVEVSATPYNLAQGKPTSQSSTVLGAEALRAVDGNTNGWFFDGSVTHTQTEAQPWWQVDLESVQAIGDIVLYNRADCCSERLSDFQVLVSDDGVTWDSYPHPGVADPQVTIAANRTGRYIKVQLNGTNALSLAEVEVFAPAPQ